MILLSHYLIKEKILQKSTKKSALRHLKTISKMPRKLNFHKIFNTTPHLKSHLGHFLNFSWITKIKNMLHRGKGMEENYCVRSFDSYKFNFCSWHLRSLRRQKMSFYLSPGWNFLFYWICSSYLSCSHELCSTSHQFMLIWILFINKLKVFSSCGFKAMLTDNFFISD